jgi:hypothetical protein
MIFVSQSIAGVQEKGAHARSLPYDGKTRNRDNRQTPFFYLHDGDHALKE